MSPSKKFLSISSFLFYPSKSYNSFQPLWCLSLSRRLSFEHCSIKMGSHNIVTNLASQTLHNRSEVTILTWKLPRLCQQQVLPRGNYLRQGLYTAAVVARGLQPFAKQLISFFFGLNFGTRDPNPLYRLQTNYSWSKKKVGKSWIVREGKNWSPRFGLNQKRTAIQTRSGKSRGPIPNGMESAVGL